MKKRTQVGIIGSGPSGLLLSQLLHFPWWFTSLMHEPGDDPLGYRLQIAELDYLAGSTAAKTVMAENYVGLPFEPFA